VHEGGFFFKSGWTHIALAAVGRVGACSCGALHRAVVEHCTGQLWNIAQGSCGTLHRAVYTRLFKGVPYFALYELSFVLYATDFTPSMLNKGPGFFELELGPLCALAKTSCQAE
jgi:hypothetical protein